VTARRRAALAALAVGMAALASPALAQDPPPPPTASEDPAETAAAVLGRRAAEFAAAVADYRASLESLLALREQMLARAAARHKGRQDLLDKGIVSRREFEETANAVAAAQRQVDETRAQIDATEHAAAEAATLEALAALPPLTPGAQQQTPLLSRYRGPAVWSLAQGAAALQQMFAARFGRALPISAFGQTALHDRMGFDHRNALDVALAPDSPEGRALIEYLRGEGIPFIAYRGAVAGSSSGAHIHVGQPSPRITVKR
jgi:hypothetical protein